MEQIFSAPITGSFPTIWHAAVLLQTLVILVVGGCLLVETIVKYAHRWTGG